MLRRRLAALAATTALAGALALPSAAVRAADATWLTSPATNDFNTASNWTPATVPSGTAFFGTSNTTNLSVANDFLIGGWTFNAGAPAYSFSNNHAIDFSGAGIINGGSATITNNGGALGFFNTSTAGSASITNNGGGILLFSDSSTAGSATIINNNSTLAFGSSSTAGSATITTNSGGLTYFLFSSASGGTARFIVNGTGLFDIAHLTSGGATAGSIEGDGKVFLGAKNLVVGGNNLSTTFSGVIQDGSGVILGDPDPVVGSIGGSLTKSGSGTLTLSGTNAYSGDTTINSGTLSVNGSIASSSGLTVNSGGTVGGTGTLPSTVIASGGTLAPGNSIGTVTVSGNLTFNAGSTYAVQVSPSAADRTNVTGTAALAGTVNATFAPGNYTLGSQYTILSAVGGLGGTTFDGLVSGNYSAGLSYTGTDVLLTLVAAQLGANQGLAGNPQHVADAINSFFNNGGTLPSGFSALFGLSGGDLANALSQLSGEAATGGQQGAFQLMSEFLALMFGPDVDGGGGGSASAFAAEQPAAFPADVARAYAAVLKAPAARAPSFARRWRVWAAGFGGYNATNGDAAAGTHDLTARTYGAAAGLDYRVTPDTVIGLALAGAGTNWGVAAGLGGGRSDAFQAGLYGRTHVGAAYASAALAFANHWMSTDRYAFAGDHLGASFNAQSYGGRIEAGYRYALPVVAVTPYAALQAQSFHTPGYSESDLTGGGFGLSYAARDATDTRSELGARFDKRMAVSADATLNLRAALAWAHDWVSDPSLTASFQALPGSSFIVNGAQPPANSALVSAAAELRLASGVTLLAKFDGDFAGGTQTYSGSGTLRYTW